MNESPTEAEVMGRGESPSVFVAYAPNSIKRKFGTIGTWQAFMAHVIQGFPEDEDPALLRSFFDLNEAIMDDLGQNPRFEKAVDVIRAQFAKALGEGR